MPRSAEICVCVPAERVATENYRLSREEDPQMILLGIVLLVLGFIFTVHILWILGILVLVIGAILAVLGGTGRAIGGRAHWY